MATKSVRVMELEDAIAQSVAALDASDGSRIGLQEGMDSARETLGDAYGIGFEKAVSEYINEDSDEEDAADFEGEVSEYDEGENSLDDGGEEGE